MGGGSDGPVGRGGRGSRLIATELSPELASEIETPPSAEISLVRSEAASPAVVWARPVVMGAIGTNPEAMPNPAHLRTDRLEVDSVLACPGSASRPAA